MIKIEHLSYSYSPRTSFRTDALIDICATVEEGDFFGIIGHTGSGKSTLVQHFNGLISIQPTKKRMSRKQRKGLPYSSGTVFVDGVDLSKRYDHKKLRGSVGMVFQYPEYQLFDETVEKDVAFGPKNIGIPAEEIPALVQGAIEAVGLDYEAVRKLSPFELSGGQKRRAALAGVLAMRPKILILDEPTAGLDPRGKKEIMDLIMSVKSETTPTIIMISHDIDDIAAYCNRIMVLNRGAVEFVLPPGELFTHAERLVELGLDIPLVTRVAKSLAARGFDIDTGIYKAEDLVEEVKKLYGGNGGGGQ